MSESYPCKQIPELSSAETIRFWGSVKGSGSNCWKWQLVGWTLQQIVADSIRERWIFKNDMPDMAKEAEKYLGCKCEVVEIQLEERKVSNAKN